MAFLPISWLLLGLHAVHVLRLGVLALVGALLHGAAFTYFSFTTRYALIDHMLTCAALLARLGGIYTAHGALMIVGDSSFARAALPAGWLPRRSLHVFLAGIIMNLELGVLPAPEILQTLGSLVRNCVMMMGHAVLSSAALSQDMNQ